MSARLVLALVGWAVAAVADEREPLPFPGPEVAEETAVFYDAADDLPDRAVERGGRLVVPFDLPAGAREVKLPMSHQVWSGFERVKILVDAAFEGEDAVESAIVRVTVRPGYLPAYSWPGFDLPARTVSREDGRLVVEVSAAEIGELAPEQGVVFPCDLNEIRLVRRAGAPAAKGYLATVDLVKEGLCEKFSCDNGKLLIANLDDPAKCRPHFTLFNNGPACKGRFAYRLYDQPTGQTLADGCIDRRFGEGESVDVTLPGPEKAGCYHIDYTLEREGGYRYSHTVSYAAMHPAGKNEDLFSDDFKFSCLTHIEFNSMNERRRLMAYMREMGANYTRAGGRYWNDFQPNGPDQPFADWKRYVKGTDICLANGVERGASILIAPKWAKDPDVDVNALAHFPRAECLEEYVAKFAGGLAGRVRHFEGNNEPNLTDWTAELEGRYERMLYKALKAARPDSIYHSGEWGGFSGTWDDDFYVKYNADDYDVIALHYHNSLNDGISAISHLELLRQKQGLVKPWWGDECANGYTNQYLQAVEMFCKNIYSRGHGAIGMTWYNLRCKGSQKPLPPGELSFGMLTWDFCPRGVYVAFNAYAKTFRKTVLKGEADLFPGIMSWRYERTSGDAALYPLWSMNRRYSTMTLAVPTDAESVEEIDLYGNVRTLPIEDGKVRVEASSDPVTLRLRPVTAALGEAELVSGDEIPDYNHGIVTPDKGATFLANTVQQYQPLYESSGENDDLVWRSVQDLMGYLLVFWPGGSDLHVRICAVDDVRHPTGKGEAMLEGDSFQLMLKLPGQNEMWEIAGVWDGDEVSDCWILNAPQGVDREEARKEIRIVSHLDRTTVWYEIYIPLGLLGTDAVTLRRDGLTLNAIINDNDGRCREGYMSFTLDDPRDPANFITVDFYPWAVEVPEGEVRKATPDQLAQFAGEKFVKSGPGLFVFDEVPVLSALRVKEGTVRIPSCAGIPEVVVDPGARILIETPDGRHVADSFESCAIGASSASLDGWSGEDGRIVAAPYDPPTPPGFVMSEETHTKVLDATEGEVSRMQPNRGLAGERIDVMVCMQRPSETLEPPDEGVQLRVAADRQGHLCLWHLYEDGGAWKKGWIPLSATTYADGEWVRLGVELDYGSNPLGDALAKVTVNGSCQPTAHGVRSPTDARAYGPWHYLARNRRTGGVSDLKEVGFAHTKVDDLLLARKDVAPEHKGPTSVDGIAFAWFDAAGLPRDPQAAAPFVPGYTLGDVFAAGLDPYSDRPFEVTGFELDADGTPHLEFNGYKGDDPVGYRIIRSSTPDFRSATALDDSDGTFDGDATTGSTVWNGKPGDSSASAFYRVEAIAVKGEEQ